MIRAPSSIGARRPSRTPRKQSWKTLTNLLRVAWAFLLLVGEYLSFSHRIHRCNWPRVTGTSRSARHFRVLVIAEYAFTSASELSLILRSPQIPDSRMFAFKKIFRLTAMHRQLPAVQFHTTLDKTAPLRFLQRKIVPHHFVVP